MQNNKNNNHNNDNATENSDEIIDILDNYRKNQDKKEPNTEKSQVSSEAQSHFTNKDEKTLPGSLGAHFSDTVNKKAILRKHKEERFKKEEKPKKKMVAAIGHSSVFFKAVFYIFFVLVISAYLSYYIIAVGNDVFALVKDEINTEISIKKDATVDEVVEILENKGLVNYPWALKLYLKYRSDEGYVFVPGTHELNSKMNYTQLIQSLTTSYVERIPVRITIPEGFTVDQIINVLLENGIGTREGYIDVINEYSYKHEFVKELKNLGYSEDRKYRLEGYLYPDTYDFYTDTEEKFVINKFLNNFNQKFWVDYKAQYKDICDEYNMSFDDIITLASMIQAEGNNALDFEYISYVFHNRLKKPKDFPKLESDATIQYILSEREEELTKDSLELDNPYNTYKYEGLPPGAICNPGFDAISAALFPSMPENENGKNVNAYFFVSNKVGKTYYASTLAGHNSNKTKVAKENEAITAGTYFD